MGADKVGPPQLEAGPEPGLLLDIGVAAHKGNEGANPLARAGDLGALQVQAHATLLQRVFGRVDPAEVVEAQGGPVLDEAKPRVQPRIGRALLTDHRPLKGHKQLHREVVGLPSVGVPARPQPRRELLHRRYDQRSVGYAELCWDRPYRFQEVDGLHGGLKDSLAAGLGCPGLQVVEQIPYLWEARGPVLYFQPLP